MELEKLEIENLRGFSYARLPLSPDRIMLVGANNSGKTSALLLLDWIFNLFDSDRLSREHSSQEEIKRLLQPARETRNSARRLSLYIKIRDGRRHNKYSCNQGVARLRFNVYSLDPIKISLRLGNPVRSESKEDDDLALNLLKELRTLWKYEHIPSFRDIKSERFQKTLHRSYREILFKKVVEQRRGTPSPERRAVVNACKELDKITSNLISPTLTKMKEILPNSMLDKNSITSGITPDTIVEWISNKILLKMSTGHHDNDGIHTSEVGSGLQSLLDLAVNSSISERETYKLIVAIEEPEAFLHPSAQRSVARQLLSMNLANKLICTTHSPIFVEEANYEDMVVTSEFKFFPADRSLEDERKEINNSLISGHGAEALFAKSVLLVEGEGDRQYFDQLRRRIAKYDDYGVCDYLYVIPTGSCSFYAPWMKMLNSFSYSSGAPLKWLAVVDGDAAMHIKKALLESEVALDSQIIAKYEEMHNAYIAKDYAEWLKHINDANNLNKEKKLPVKYLTVDLESAILSKFSSKTIDSFVNQMDDYNYQNTNKLLKDLGSKAEDCKVKDKPIKAPWLRGVIGKITPSCEISDQIYSIIEVWMEKAADLKSARKILKTFKENDSEHH